MLPGGSVSVGYAINNSAQVAGYTYDGHYSHATIWNGTTPTALGTLPGWEDSLAVGINDLGQVVGYSRGGKGDTKATIWDGTTPIDLSTLLGGTGAGWTLSQATAINSVGQIVGWGFNRLGLQRGFLLTPGTKADCKDGGWRNFISLPGPFMNEGQCISYFAKQ
jgi:probable HAF family extracellular repeat protein